MTSSTSKPHPFGDRPALEISDARSDLDLCQFKLSESIVQHGSATFRHDSLAVMIWNEFVMHLCDVLVVDL